MKCTFISLAQVHRSTVAHSIHLRSNVSREIPFGVGLMGEGVVASEGRFVGEQMFHSWRKCITLSIVLHLACELVLGKFKLHPKMLTEHIHEGRETANQNLW